MRLLNLKTGTRPVIVHAQGGHSYKPHWEAILEALFAEPPANSPADERLTVITCNNGAEGMGLFERSLDRLGVRYRVAGRGVARWSNARDKPPAILQALREIETPYVLYADSRDAVALEAPAVLLPRFLARSCRLVFSADMMNWPPVREFQKFEDAIPGARASDFRYLNGGVWIGEVSFCRDFFAEAVRTPPRPEAVESEQGILKQLFPRFFPDVRLDNGCEMFQNIGFVGKPIFRIETGRS